MKQDKIWDYFQNEKSESFVASYARLYDLATKFDKNTKVLNIGVGGGIFEKIATARGLEVYSLDPSDRSIEKLQKNFGMSHAKVGYSQNIPFKDNSFDGVIMSEVLEHLSDDIIEKSLLEVSRVLKKGAKFVGTVPYDENLDIQQVVCPNCGEKFHRWGHIQNFNIIKISTLLKNNFSISIVRPKMYVTWNTLNWKGKLSASILFFLYLLRINKSNLTLYFEAKKK